MTDWNAYAESQRHDKGAYAAEPVQVDRLDVLVRRARGSVLDVGSSDGYSASLIKLDGHDVIALDVAHRRIERARDDYDVTGVVADATALPFPDASFDTVVLGEIVEHITNPGAAMIEAFRVARERVVVSVPLNGWSDPTHVWRVSLDQLYRHRAKPTKHAQIVVTFQRGECWPDGYHDHDASWTEQFVHGR